MFISQKCLVWEISHLEDLIFVRLKGVQFEFQVPQVPEGNSLEEEDRAVTHTVHHSKHNNPRDTQRRDVQKDNGVEYLVSTSSATFTLEKYCVRACIYMYMWVLHYLICRAGGQDELAVRVEGQAVDLRCVCVHSMAGFGGVVGASVPATSQRERGKQDS